MCIHPRCAARGSLFAAAALGRGRTLADTALCTLGTSSWAARAAACGRDKNKIKDILRKSQAGVWWGGVSLFWRPLMYSCHSLLAASPFLAVSSRVFMQPWLALERQGESVEHPRVHQDSIRPSLCKPSWHIALLWVTASGAPRRNPSAGFLPSIPLC